MKRRNAKTFTVLFSAAAILVGLTGCTQAQTTSEACLIIDNIGKEANAQARDDAQQRRHLETSLRQITNPELKEYTDQILSELQNAKKQLSDLETTQQSDKKATAELRRTILEQTNSTVTAIKATSIDRICR